MCSAATPTAGESGAVPNSAPYTVAVSVLHGGTTLVNGGFEQPAGFGQYPAIPGWVLPPDTGGGTIEIDGNNIGTPYEGDQFVELNSFAPGTITQTVATVPGQTYRLTFAFSARPETGPAANDVLVSFDGAAVTEVSADGSELGNTRWTLYTFDVTATGSTADLTFASLTPTDSETSVGGLIDAVRLVPLGVAIDVMTVSDPAVLARPAGPVAAVEGAPAVGVLLATFTDPGGPEPVGNYSADIDWGDGDPLDVGGGSVALVGGVFEVRGTHTYADESGAAPFTVTVTIHHGFAPDATVTTTAVVSDPAVVAAGGRTLAAVEGRGSAPQVVATFTDPGGPEATGNYSATIDWGDGSVASPGAIAPAGGTFTVTAPAHTYADEGTFTVTVRVGHDATPVQTVTSTATVAEGDVLAGTAPNLRVVRGETFSGPVATFTNTGYPGNPAADFAATIDWGDGTPPRPGAVSGAGSGRYVVSGAHTYATPGQFTPTVTLADDAPGTAAAAATATATATATTLVVPQLIAVGAVAGGSEVRLVDVSTGAAYRTFVPYGADFTGGIAVALGDVTGDGFPDLATAAGAGGASHIKVYDGLTGAEVYSFFAYDPSFRDGAYVAVGDVDGDGRADIVTGAGFNGGPHVKVFSGRDLSLLASFFAYDSSFRNGVRVGTADVNGDGKADVVTGAGPGGGPHVKVFDVAHGLATLQSYFAYAATFTGGVYVGGGDVDGDGFDDVITGAASGGSGHVRVVSGRTGADLANFFAFSPNTRDGATAAGGLPDAAGRDRVLVGLGARSPAVVKRFDTISGSEEDVFSTLDAGFLNGVYVS